MFTVIVRRTFILPHALDLGIDSPSVISGITYFEIET